MENIIVQFNLPTDELLLGIYYTDGQIQDLHTDEIQDCQILSIGFLLFSIDIYIKKQ